jgi:hypothetical protein
MGAFLNPRRYSAYFARWTFYARQDEKGVVHFWRASISATARSKSATGLSGNFGYIVGDPNHGRCWNTAFETTGPAYIARDNGFSGTLSFSPSKYMDIQIGYNHSVRYHLDDVIFTVAFNANSLFRKATRY